jgi:cysteine-rich repeat protein
VLLVACGGGSQKPATCGDGVVQADEQCDDGDLDGTAGDGCNELCMFACADPGTDCDTPPACEVASCTAAHTCMIALDPTQEGLTCGMGLICRSGSCVSTMCGNGVIEPGEQCDFGSDNGIGAGCATSCQYSCQDSTGCDDGDPCDGVETCVPVMDGAMSGQKCAPGTGEADNTTCGTQMICVAHTCVAASCGDGFVTSPEECDDSNRADGDGCDNDCTFTCLSTDPMRDCTPADACAGQGSCDDGTHTCTAGTPLADGTPCGTGDDYCKAGACTAPVCGNGIVEAGETCDDGPANGTRFDGCSASCTFVCVDPATDCGSPLPCDTWACTGSHTCEIVADDTQNGAGCGSGFVCEGGSCAAPGAVCGNGTVEPGEQCDFGAGNGAGTGCEFNCRFSCTSTPNSCDDGNACNGTETCNMVTVAGHTGQQCAAGTPESDGTACVGGRICLASACVTSTCGDGYVDTSAGEDCEPPNSATCDSSCRTIVCGNGILQGSEQCDDGNTLNLDGCDASCNFEQVHRMNTLAVAFGNDGPTGFCTQNALGGAIVGSIAQSEINSAISNGIADGSITIIFDLLGLTDLSGTSDPTLAIGVIGGSPVPEMGYVGDCPPQDPSTGLETGPCTSDLEWWYTVDPTTIDASRTATTQLAGSIAAKVLDSPGPGEFSITVNFVGVAVTMDLFQTKVRATIGPSSTPITSSDGTTPGHLTSEHVAPALQSFQTSSSGEVCGVTAAQSLANTLTPSDLTGSTCGSFYATSNSLLDVYVSGCKALGIVSEVNATQPDASRDGAVYRFTANASHQVVSCTRNGVADTLADCIANAGYSSLFKYTTDRIIAK